MNDKTKGEAAQDVAKAPTAQTAQETAPRKEKIPSTLFVIDSTAIPGKGDREHVMTVDGIDTPYVFSPGKPLELPFAVAIKFLKHPEFKRTDKDGKPEPYHRPPKQPDEMQAGETFKLADDETVAKYSELSNMALLQRTLELPGGENINKDSRPAMIEFITKSALVKRAANKAKAPDIGRDEFVPEAEVEEAA